MQVSFFMFAQAITPIFCYVVLHSLVLHFLNHFFYSTTLTSDSQKKALKNASLFNRDDLFFHRLEAVKQSKLQFLITSVHKLHAGSLNNLTRLFHCSNGNENMIKIELIDMYMNDFNKASMPILASFATLEQYCSVHCRGCSNFLEHCLETTQ